MTKLVIVGDKPSKLNISEDIPFVGASCFTRLVDWVKHLSPDYYLIFNSETQREMSEIELLANNGFKVVALGRFASTRLKDRDIPHYCLPHPSLRNKTCNDKELMKNLLNEAHAYIRS